MAWSNEIVYWTTIFIMAFVFLKSGKWKETYAIRRAYKHRSKRREAVYDVHERRPSVEACTEH